MRVAQEDAVVGGKARIDRHLDGAAAALELPEFVVIAGSLKLRGASGAPMRPIALPLRDRSAGGS